MKKALIVVTSHNKLGSTGKKTGYHLAEVTHPFFKLKEANIEVDFVSPKGGKAPMDEKTRDTTDPENKKFLDDSLLMANIENTLKPEQINPKDYCAIIFAGGHGTMWDFPNDKQLAKLTTAIYEQGGVIGAVCHGPAALINVRLSNGKYLVDGRTIVCFTNEEEQEVGMIDVVPFLLADKLTEHGASIKIAPNWSNNTTVSDRIVTGQNPKSAADVGKLVAELINKMK